MALFQHDFYRAPTPPRWRGVAEQRAIKNFWLSHFYNYAAHTADSFAEAPMLMI